METPDQYSACFEKDKVMLVTLADDAHKATVIFEENRFDPDKRALEGELMYEKCSIYEKMDRTFFGEKLVFMLSVATVVMVTCSLTSFQWNIPYIYLILLTIIMPYRIYKYWQMKQQFFLLDWCYFSNLLLIVYLIGFPECGTFFTILFGLSNGPVAWAILTFRNCLVLHSVERMTNLLIHILPMLVVYGVRWYPEETASLWYKTFSQTPMVLGGEEEEEDLLGESMLWLFVVPLAVYMTHSIIYVVTMNVILTPSDEYSNIYRYMSEPPGSLSKCAGCAGERFRPLVFLSLNGAYAVLTLLSTWLWFHYYIANIAFICLMAMVASYNGATFYLHPFIKKGLAADPYRLCGKD